MMNASSLDPRTMRVIETPISPFLQNAPILACEETSEAILVDPGDEVEKILDVAKSNNLNIKYIVLTHGHIDHAGGTKKIAEILNIDIVGPHEDDKFLLDSLELQGQMYGIAAQAFEPNRWLEHGDTLTFGNQELEIAHCPGHTPGHIVLIDHNSRIIIAGDVLFQGSIGRTDLPRGNHQDLLDSIKSNLLTLDDDYKVYSGHGAPTNIGVERQTNPFLVNA